MPASSVSSRRKCQTCLLALDVRGEGDPVGWVAGLDGERLGLDVVALGIHPEQDRTRGRVAAPGADPAFEPVGLGDRCPHGLDRGLEGAVEHDAVVTVAESRGGRWGWGSCCLNSPWRWRRGTRPEGPSHVTIRAFEPLSTTRGSRRRCGVRAGMAHANFGVSKVCASGPCSARTSARAERGICGQFVVSPLRH